MSLEIAFIIFLYIKGLELENAGTVFNLPITQIYGNSEINITGPDNIDDYLNSAYFCS